jgi:hypothetical protein
VGGLAWAPAQVTHLSQKAPILAIWSADSSSPLMLQKSQLAASRSSVRPCWNIYASLGDSRVSSAHR